jgi:hypothetical protein
MLGFHTLGKDAAGAQAVPIALLVKALPALLASLQRLLRYLSHARL